VSDRLRITEVIADLKAGKTTRQVAKLYGVTPQAVRNCCYRHGFSIAALNSFKEAKADLLAWKQSQIVEAMSPEKIETASLRDQATALNIINNVEKLERGQATSNINIHAVNQDLESVEAEIVRLTQLIEQSTNSATSS